MINKTDTCEFTAELTDTFGGEANYAWVKRETFTAPRTISDRALMRRAKAATGLTGVRGRMYNHGDMLEFRPYRRCMVLFVAYQEPAESWG